MKRIMFVPMVLLMVGSVYAQPEITTTRKAFSIGPCGGYGHAWIGNYKNTVFLPSVSFGIFGTYTPHEHWGIGADVRLSQEGSIIEPPESGQVTRRLDYVRVPVRVMYLFRQEEFDFRPKVTLGPSFGFNFGKDVPSNTAVEYYDIGMIASTGFNYRLDSFTYVNLDVGYYHGFSDAITSNIKSDMNRNVAVSLGIGFEL